jgi:site-specific recombinase XerD
VSAVAPLLEAFFTERLIRQRRSSAHTIASYRDAFRLLLVYARDRTGKQPCQLDLADLDAQLIAGFLEHLEHDRHNSIRSRNARLTAIRSFYHFASYREPGHAALIAQVLAIPGKRADRRIVSYLVPAEIDALLAAPDRSTWLGRRDHALLAVTVQAGLRVSEVTQLKVRDLTFGTGAHLRVEGKGRKERAIPLDRHSVAVLSAWLTEQGPDPDQPLFPARTGGHLSNDAVSDLVHKHVTQAAQTCPTLTSKRVTAHTLRHSCAMTLLREGVDIAVIALWLGHEHVQTTNIYMHGDLSVKEKALARTAPAGTPIGRYRPPDQLLAFLESL